MEPSRWGFDWEAMSERCVRALVLAQQEAEFLQDAQVGTEHVLIGLLSGRNAGGDMLAEHGVDVHLVRADLAKRHTRGERTPLRRFSWRVRRAVERAFEEAASASSPFVTTDHLYAGLLQQEDGTAVGILVALGVPVPDLLRRLRGRQGPSGETDLLFTADLLHQLPVAEGDVPEMEQVPAPAHEMTLDRFLEVLDELSRALQTAQQLVQAARPRRLHLDIPEVAEGDWPVVDEEAYQIAGLVRQILTELVARGAERVELMPEERALRVAFHLDGNADTVDIPAILRTVVPFNVMRMAGLNPMEKGRELEGRVTFRQGDLTHALQVRSEPVRLGLRVVVMRLDGAD